jgi:hypothetical protein
MKRRFTLLTLLTCLFLGMTGNAQEVLFTENFDYTPGIVPPGWTNSGEQPSNWKVNNSQISGGTAPELYLNYGFQVGLTRLISPIVNLSGHDKLDLSYKQYVINYGADWGETIGLDVTFDGGLTWTTLWERPLGLLNIPQDEFHYFISVPVGASQMQIGFRYDGNNNAINGWAIDDIKVETVVENDLLATVIEGSSTPFVGQNNLLTLEIVNGGSTLQNNYTVKIFSNEDEEILSTTGNPIEFGEKVYHQVYWSPTQSQLGIESIYAVVELAADENPANNQSSPFYLKVLPSNTTYTTIGEGSFPLIHSSPYNFFTLHSLSQTLYLNSDINITDASLVGIQYTCQFDEDVNDVPIQIYLAETTQNDLLNGWLNPSEFTLVYNGMMDFKKGFNNLYITLDEAFDYTNKNLVVYSNKSHSEMVLWSTFMSTYNENGDFSRIVDGDGAAFDPMNPPTSYPVYYSPNISFFFSDGQMAVIDQNQTQVSIYPNPVSDKLNVQLNTNEKIEEIRIINSVGQLLMNQKVGKSSAEVDVRNLSSGFYLVQIITANNSITKKILVK